MKFVSLVASLGFHILLTFLALHNFSDIQTPESKVEIVIEPVKEILRPKVASVNKSASKLMGTRKARSLIQLFPENEFAKNTELQNVKALSAGKAKLEISFNDSRAYDTDVSEIFGEDGNENWPLYKEIYAKVDSNLNFDSLLAQYNHFGRVYVQFQLDDKGMLRADNLKVEARDSILKVHVLRALKKSLGEPMALRNRMKGDAGLLYQAKFDFNFGNYRENFYKQKNFGRPVFSFNRFTEEKPVPEDLLEQLLTGGVSPNVSLMYERWQKYNQKIHRKAVKFDPFESYRRDSFYKL